ncbi:tetratricopeptide repeat protein [Actinomadura sp. NAK00032]|nr:tetratricopeptide repeat protein [Actinomadura sp. NAK00032]
MLAVLLLAPRQPVPAETIIRRVWGDDPPAKARQGLHVYMTRLRRRLEDVEGVALISRQGSYLIDVDDESVDLHRFRRLRDQARAIAESGDDEYALDHHRRAAELCRAEPLANLSGSWAERIRHALEQELLAAAFLRIDLELRRGNHADLVRELYDLTERHPQNQWPAERLMVALYRCGRQAEALDVYRRTHDLLVAESGTDPGPGMRQIQQQILRGDPELLRVPGTQLSVDRRPHTLPHDARVFVGREDELRQLMDMVPMAAGPPAGSAVTVIALDGMAGVGKSMLAVHLAHRLAAHFPDGQMFLPLHAHDARQKPVDPADALDTLLRMINVPVTRVPRALDERAALWRSELAGSRAILVLDDAAGHDQVRPLLPASAGCLVIVTSRRRLTGLHDAWPLSLETLPVRDAMVLFTGIAGAGRAETDADVAAVVECCGRLPLAVSMAASRLRHRRTWDTGDLLARLSSDDRRLDELRDEDREITTVFEVSYRGLPPQLRDAFRAFGLHPGPDLTADAGAAALACPVREAERILEELLDRHLITEPARGRYRFHDLVQDYARRVSRETDTDEERRRTVHRILDFYLAAADHANHLLSPHRTGDTEPDGPQQHSPPLENEADAAEWFAAEHACLMNAAAEADRIGSAEHVARFSRVLAGHLESRGRWDAAARLHTKAVEALQGLDDHPRTARALVDLSHIRFRVGDYDTAMEDAEKALDIYRSIGDRSGEAHILGRISLIHWHQSRFPEALTCCREAVEIHRSLGDRRGEAENLDRTAIVLEFTGDYREAERLRLEALAILDEIDAPGLRTMALNNMGDLMIRRGDVDRAAEYYAQIAGLPELSRQHEAIVLINAAHVHRRTGAYETALANYRAALAIAMELGDRRTQVDTLIGIGATFHNTGRYGESIIHHERALAISRSINERYEETVALRHLGEALTTSGRYRTAVEHLRQAYALSAEIGVPDEQAKALASLGAALLHVQGSEAARRPWEEALRLFTTLNLPEAQDLRARLQSLDHATGT